MSKLEIKLDKKVKILLTRPEKDALNFSKYLDKNSFESYLAPLIQIIKCKYEFDKNVDYDFVLFTSKNGLRNFQKIEHKKQIFVIGDGTFNLAKKIGYENVTNIKGDTNDLKTKMKPFLQKNTRKKSKIKTMFMSKRPLQRVMLQTLKKLKRLANEKKKGRKKILSRGLRLQKQM